MCIFGVLTYYELLMIKYDQYRYLCRKEACEYLGITESTIKRYVKELGFPEHRIGNSRPFYIREELDDWIKKSIKN